ncbi:uncharacterized protein LOC127878664 [Dreissena polymorpha]|uniref:uncharacterized protein LOC127878664 n=1 Tax=Dreissena polymorpha TaxID=45954 RepID=UPI0022654CC8|nr:uncharacterized protein LOC127878664 [Dreissena polymorpha]
MPSNIAIDHNPALIAPTRNLNTIHSFDADKNKQIAVLSIYLKPNPSMRGPIARSTFIRKANTFCKEELNRQKIILRDILKEKSVDGNHPDVANLTKLIKTGTTDFSIGLVFQAFRKEIAADYYPCPKIINSSPIFTRECVKICWLANLSAPPISSYAKKRGDDFDENFFREYTCKGKKVDFVVMPALVNKDGDVVAKGVV